MNSNLQPNPRWVRLSERELAWCLRLNRPAGWVPVEKLFAVVSRLGNGVFWYTLMIALLLIYGQQALPAVIGMLTTAALGLILYKWCKGKTSRPRPYTCNQAIRVSVAPLDTFSFPSGHTLHAVGFSTVALHYFPELAWLLAPFTLLVALSRMVLGLHYPSDVLAGAMIGMGLALLVLQFSV